MKSVLQNDEIGGIHSVSSGRFPVIVSQKTSESGFALDLRGFWWTGSRRREGDQANGPVVDSLMRADGIVKDFVFPDQMLKMTFPEDDKMIEALVADSLDKTFGEGVQVGRFRGKPLHFCAFTLNNGIKGGGELGVAVADQIGDRFASVGQAGDEVAGLLLGPRTGGVAGDSGKVNLPGSDVNEEENVAGDFAESGPHFLGEEIARPERFHLALEEAIPISLGSAGAGMESVFDEHIFDSVPGDDDAEFHQLTLDAGITPGILSCHAKNDGREVPGQGRTSRGEVSFADCGISRSADPVQESLVMDNRDQFSQRNPQAASELKKSRALGGGDTDRTGNSGAENSVFRTEICDLAQQRGLGDMDEEEENGIGGNTGHEKGGDNEEFAWTKPEQIWWNKLQSMKIADVAEFAMAHPLAHAERSFCTPLGNDSEWLGCRSVRTYRKWPPESNFEPESTGS